MQFVKDGPDVPDELLHRHEDGSVVFFCGAGISYPAKLPGFHDLVMGIYSELHSVPDVVEDEALKKKQYDVTIDLLEHRIPGGRLAVRSALARVLKPNLKKAGATTTHKSLLTLARSRDGNSRLVTTNFDRIFESVMLDRARRVPTFPAPLLPIPKDSKWHGLVYLHGLLPKIPTEKDLNRLVVSSGDFGLAYLTERWAARFLSELFRNYTVCFVGYSIDDPVLRYMMDALAADRMLGESTLPSYAFASFEASRRVEIDNVWRAKRVTPILYEVPAGTNNHVALHQTLKEWADTHRDGVNAKEQIIVRHALGRPSGSTIQDDFVGRVIWALSDSGGLPAKRFAELDPPPPIEWLEEMWKPRFRHSDLVRFLVVPNKSVDHKLQFALVKRPSPYGLSPWMSLLSSDPRSSNWDSVMYHIACWLVRHLTDPTLILWVAARGGTIHPAFGALIRKGLAASPPPPPLRTLWRLVLSNRVRGRPLFPDLYQWFDDLNALGYLSATLRTTLRALLAPMVSLNKPFRLREDTADGDSDSTLRNMVDWEVVLTSEHVHYVLRDSKGSEVWQASIGALLSDFTDVLREAFDLMRELGGANDLSDLSYIHQPSIEEHPQNQYFQEWTALVELLRESWVAAARTNARAAYLETERWGNYRYPIFRRFTLFAATHNAVFTGVQSLGCLLEDGGWWLWSSETQREALQLLGHVVPRLSSEQLIVLEEAILVGPPRDMFRDDITADQWISVVHNSVWLRLAKWRDSGVALLPAGEARISALAVGQPERAQTVADQSEFAFWMGSGGDWREFVPAPIDYRELPSWLQEHPGSVFQQRDDWQERCKATFRQAAWALLTLAKRGTWLPNRWSEALQAWSVDELRSRSWRWVKAALARAPDRILREIAPPLIWWMRPMADSAIVDEETWFDLIERILTTYQAESPEPTDDPVGKAINHPVGQATEAVLHFWYRQQLADSQGLPDRISAILSRVSDRKVEAYRHGRVILAQAVITLFRVDRDWTVQNVLPLFDWNASHGEARMAWEGFLWTPRIYFPFLGAIKAEFLATAMHYRELQKHSEQYAAFLTFTALEQGGAFSRNDLARATAELPPEGLRRCARALLDAIKGSGEQAPEYWRNRILPYINDIWPKNVNLVSDEISTAFAQICVAAGDGFPDAYSTLHSWLQPLTRPDRTVTLLEQAKICSKFPGTALSFLDAITNAKKAEWAPRQLATCLAQIEAADSTLAQDTRFRRLLAYARQQNLKP